MRTVAYLGGLVAAFVGGAYAMVWRLVSMERRKAEGDSVNKIIELEISRQWLTRLEQDWLPIDGIRFRRLEDGSYHILLTADLEALLEEQRAEALTDQDKLAEDISDAINKILGEEQAE